LSRTETYSKAIAIDKSFSKWEDYKMLVKLKLSAVVVITSILSYAVVAGVNFSLVHFLMLAIGGFLVTGAANAINQVLEKDFDKLMTRTAERPVTAGRMKSSEAVMFAGISCLIGISILALFNPITALLGMLSFVMYAFVYTPMKRYSTSAVAIGAVPGALPVLIGCTAFEGSISLLAISLFTVQFLWQFPHFWAIGYLAFEDYSKAGYKLLPVMEDEQKIDRQLGMHSVVYALLILPVMGILFYFGEVSIVATIIGLISTLIYAFFGVKFHQRFDRVSARNLMFCSFFYMPIILVAYLIF